MPPMMPKLARRGFLRWGLCLKRTAAKLWENVVENIKEVLKIKKYIFILVAILLVAFPSLAYAEECEVDSLSDILRKNLFLAFKGAGSPLNSDQVKDLLIFYLSIPSNAITADCSSTGSNSGLSMSSIVDVGKNAADIIPSCSDGTKYGRCSTSKPGYCYAGNLINNCDDCGCPSGYTCNAGECQFVSSNITCFSDMDCEADHFEGSHYCSSNTVTRNYLDYTCNNAGTESSSCISSNSSVILDNCNPNANLSCIDGYSTCQVSSSDTQPPSLSNGQPSGNLSANTTSTSLSLTTDESATCRYSLTIGTVYSSMTNNFSATGDTAHSTSISGLNDGTSYGYYARCQDASGNANTNDYLISFSVSSNVDAIQPSVSITGPASNSTVNSSINVNADATDNVGVVGVQFKLDGANLGFEDIISPYSVAWDSSSASNGAHTLTATARDAAGNTKTSATVNVLVSNAVNIAPNAIIYANITSGFAPLNVFFDGSSSFDIDGYIIAYNWSFGDGTNASFATGSHLYTISGLYLVDLIVKDDGGLTSSAMEYINVT